MKTKDYFFFAIGALFVVGFFICLALVIFRVFPQENSAIINVMFGTLISGVGTILNYFYGSSKGSQEKDILLANKTPEDTLEFAKSDYFQKFGVQSPLGRGMFEIREAIKSGIALKEIP